ncbi:MAG TPA: response regulator transcription factor [Candidatus Xenobia bacterium]|jgi:DNA-binding NarL/FixJ family response regulator
MIRVVIADVHAILRDGVKLLLEAESDMEVVGQAGNGLEAVRQASDLKPDILVTDIQLPEVDGIEACARIGRHAPMVRVLILSQLDSEEHLIRALEAGAQGYLLKQNASDELVNAIRAVVAGHVYLTPAMASRLVSCFLRRDDDPREKGKHLTAREQDVLKGICAGSTNQEIADELSLSIKTVQSHRSNIMDKLDLHNRVDLVKYAIKMGLATG